MKIFNFIALIISAISCQIEVNQHFKMRQSMFGTSNFGTEVTWTPICGLRHQIFTSKP